VEVKTVTEKGRYSLTPEDQMTRGKVAKFKRVAQLFAGNNESWIYPKSGWRLDVVAITLPSDALERTAQELLPVAKINHYENI